MICEGSGSRGALNSKCGGFKLCLQILWQASLQKQSPRWPGLRDSLLPTGQSRVDSMEFGHYYFCGEGASSRALGGGHSESPVRKIAGQGTAVDK